MKKKKFIFFIIFVLLILHLSARCGFCLSTRHHLINAGKNFFKMVIAPFKGVFVTGPKNIAEAYHYEAYEDDTPNKLLGIWRAPGEEAKGILDGIVETVDNGRKCLWELISIPFGD